MDRRTFLKSTGAAAATAGATTAAHAHETDPSVQNQANVEPIRTRLSPLFQSRYMRDVADRFALRLSELSQKRLQLEFVPEQATTTFAAIDSGACDAYIASEAEHLANHPALVFFAGLPGKFGLSPEHQAQWLSAGGGQLLWDDLAAERGVKALNIAHSGRAPGLWSTTDFDMIADLKNQSIRSFGLGLQIVEQLGATNSVATSATTSSTAWELPMGPTAALSEHTNGPEKFWFRSGLHQNGVAISFGLSSKIWNSLSDTDKALITAAADASYQHSISEHETHDKMVAPHLLKHRRIAVRQLPDDIQRAISHISQSLIENIRSTDTDAARVVDAYMHFSQTVTGVSWQSPNGAIA